MVILCLKTKIAIIINESTANNWSSARLHGLRLVLATKRGVQSCAVYWAVIFCSKMVSAGGNKTWWMNINNFSFYVVQPNAFPTKSAANIMRNVKVGSDGLK